MTNAILGAPLDRIDARLKVTGAARYAAEMPLANLAHAVLVQSTIGAGRITAIDAKEAEEAPGVLFVMTPFDTPRTAKGEGRPQQPGEAYPLLQDEAIHYNGQHVALVLAESLEQAMHAAEMVGVTYDDAPVVPHLEDAASRAFVPEHFRGGARPPDSRRGDPEKAFSGAAVRVDETYTTPVEHHNPMEPLAVIAEWEGERLVVYHSTQAISGSHESLAKLLGLPRENIRIVCQFVGGGFGCKGSTWPHVALAAMAARRAGRPVKLVLTRRQMFSSNGFRSRTIQRLRLGAESDGRLVAVMHDGLVQTSTFGEWVEPVGLSTEIMYSCPNLAVTHRVAPVNAGIPTFMRAPGEASGMYALEAAMDELSWRLGIDPIELRLRNHAERDEHENLPWSSKSLKQCYARGAEAFGWSRRDPRPGAMRDGRHLIGFGMASATYPMNRSAAHATVRLRADGSALVASGTQDLGTGTYTIMVQAAAAALGLPPDRVTAQLGDSALPQAPGSGGSQSAASVLPAVTAAAQAVRAELLSLAAAPHGPFAGANDLEIADGVVFAKADSGRRRTVPEILAAAGRESIEETRGAEPGDEKKRFAMHSFGAHFAEVRVDPELGEVRLARYVGAFAAGRILNPKTARSQMLGGITFGIGMALTEETFYDRRSGRIVNANLAEYLVPVHADVPDIEILFIEEQDDRVNPLGIKGVGELPTVGAAAAIANGVYHATGRRIRDLPIRPEKVMAV